MHIRPLGPTRRGVALLEGPPPFYFNNFFFHKFVTSKFTVILFFEYQNYIDESKYILLSGVLYIRLHSVVIVAVDYTPASWTPADHFISFRSHI